MKRYKYSYDEFSKDVALLADSVEKFNPDTILAIARGGLTLGHFIASALKLRRVFSLNSIHYDDTNKLDTIEIFNIPNLNNSNRVLVVDDIVDSGETLYEVIKVLKNRYPNCQFKIATLFYKPTAIIRPDFTLKEAKEWIDFFWEF